MKLPVQTIKFACTITWLLTSLISTQPILLAISALPKPPKTGTPKGNSTPGGTRPESTCKETNKPLTALIANNGSDFTLSQYPNFWFYIPYAPEDISYMEFSLLDGRERRTIYRTGIKLTERPGVIKITIPSEQKYSLKPNETYRWYFMLHCNPNKTGESDKVVDGWVQRKSMNLNLKNQLESVKSQEYVAYSANGIWYDAVNNLATLHFDHPGNPEFNTGWANLLKYLGKDSVVQEPLVPSVLLSPKSN
jgi:hypothetical protein